MSVSLGKAKRLLGELEEVLKPVMENPTAGRLRDDARSWVAEMEALAGMAASCQVSAQAEINKAAGLLAQTEARSTQTTVAATVGAPEGDPKAQKQEAESILADARNQGELAADYDSAAETARQRGERCVSLLRSEIEASAQRDAASPAGAQPDCNTLYPGSRATYVQSLNATLCLCPDGRRADQPGGCGERQDPRCTEMEHRFDGARDSASAQAIINEAQALGCPVSQAAISRWNRRHQLQCEAYAQHLWATRDLKAARTIVQEANALGCNLQIQSMHGTAGGNRKPGSAVSSNCRT